MKRLLTLIALTLTASALAQEAEEPATPTSVIADAAPEEWLSIAPDDLLVMDLAPDNEGHERRVVIQLIPPPFSQPWVANIRTLARAHWWDGSSVNRVQDNYVTQWGDVTEAKPLPEGVVAPVSKYSSSVTVPERDRMIAAAPLVSRAGREAFPGFHFFDDGWPLVTPNTQHTPICRVAEESGRCIPLEPDEYSDEVWPIHCYGYVGVGRNVAPDTGTGAELYTIIGTPQRHMDRNLAVVGRVIEGMEHLSSLPRGHGELGFYTEEEAHLRVPIVSVRLGSEVSDFPSFEYLDSASESFARYVEVRANRNDTFYTVPAGRVDVCSVQVPVRRVVE